MAKHRIMQTTLYGTLVFWNQRSWRISSGVTVNGSAKCRLAQVKVHDFFTNISLYLGNSTRFGLQKVDCRRLIGSLLPPIK